MIVIISGGGIGGLTAALCLNHFGIEAEIHEKAPELLEIGAGIQISPNAMKVFQALGLDDKIVAAGFLPEAIEIRRGEGGSHLIKTPLKSKTEKRYGAPYVHIHRADLVACLKAAVSERSGILLNLASSVVGFRQSDAAVSVELESGQTHDADALIGADGIHSAVRHQMLGPDAPRFTGNVALRAVVSVKELGSNIPAPTACAWVGSGKHAVTYLLRGGELANLVAVVERGDWQIESWSEPANKEEALRDFAGWHPIVTDMLEASDELYRWALFDRDPLTSWVSGRAALLGDAAHPMLPFMAQGAAMAIEDAWALAASLSLRNDLPEALRDYQNVRYARASKVQAKSRANADLFHAGTFSERVIRQAPIRIADRVAPQLGLQQQDWIYGYDIVEAMGV